MKYYEAFCDKPPSQSHFHITVHNTWSHSHLSLVNSQQSRVSKCPPRAGFDRKLHWGCVDEGRAVCDEHLILLQAYAELI